MSGRHELVAHLAERGITDPGVLAAMALVPREEFVPASSRDEAYGDRAMAIGHGQTISQPLMVALMVQALELRAGDAVLDVGTGSGYQAAVMAACGTRVVGVERIPELATEAGERLRRLGYAVDVVCGDGSLGLSTPGDVHFDAIAVGAAAPRLPVGLARQLADGGRLVVPISGPAQGEMLTRLRVTGGRWLTENLGPCRFVPLIGADGYENGDTRLA
ncbi:MAG: protein-L-isoaspartate(D-aspartate) O-methyltransferase [Candidatus Dormibacteria bacterium]